MSIRYRLTRQARVDVRTIWEHIADGNLAAADRIAARLLDAFATLARFPQNGHRREDIHTSEPVLFWPVGNYIVVYRPAPKPVLIVRVLHGARDLDALL